MYYYEKTGNMFRDMCIDACIKNECLDIGMEGGKKYKNVTVLHVLPNSFVIRITGNLTIEERVKEIPFYNVREMSQHHNESSVFKALKHAFEHGRWVNIYMKDKRSFLDVYVCSIDRQIDGNGYVRITRLDKEFELKLEGIESVKRDLLIEKMEQYESKDNRKIRDEIIKLVKEDRMEVDYFQ